MNPPKVMCNTKIYHPNIDYEGHVCLNILRDQDWTPVMTITQVVQGISFLFYEPNPIDPLNKEAAELMSRDKPMFQRKIRETFRGGVYNGFFSLLSPLSSLLSSSQTYQRQPISY